MEIINLLDFLNNTKELHALKYSSCNSKFVNLLTTPFDEQFTQNINLGLFYINFITLDQITIIDGINRLLSLSLLLHAICECYKKTSPKNDEAIKTIREKYLLDDKNSTKIKLPNEYQDIYKKIIFGEKLSGKEKQYEMFQLLHNYWVQIKEENLQASKILKMLEKFSIITVEIDNISPRELYYNLNKDKLEIDQILLIEDYLSNLGLNQDWNSLKKLYIDNNLKLEIFFKDFFATKFNYKEYSNTKLYENFTNYFKTMLQYLSKEVLISKLKRVAEYYIDIINVNLPSADLKKILIDIKMHNGEDTFAYILNIYEDFIDGNLSESTFLEILITIDEYLQNRLKTPNNVSFNELINYLNAFITCK